MRRFLVLFLFLFLTSCAVSAGNSAAPNVGVGGLPEQVLADAQATANAANIVIEATRQASIQQTAIAQESTRQAIASQTAIAQEATAVALATRDALMIEQTAVAVQMSIDQATASALESHNLAMAQQTAVAVTIAAEQERERQRTENTIMLRSAQAREFENDAQWEKIFNSILAGFGITVIVFLFLIGLAILLRVRNLNNNPVQHFHDETQHATIVVVPNGLFGTDIRQLGGKSIVSNNQNLLTSGNEQPEIINEPDAPALPPIRKGHVLIVGETGSGKSTAMRAVIRGRENVTVLDPHAAPGEWGDARVIGAGFRFDEIGAFMGTMLEVLEHRYQVRATRPGAQFDPMTVATDEMPAIVSELDKSMSRTWDRWVRQGRKVNLFFVVSTQSTRVRSLGIEGEGDILENFSAAIFLGEQAKSTYGELVAGMSRPAVLKMRHTTFPVVIPNVVSRIEYADNFGILHDDPDIIDVTPEPPQGLETEYGFVPQHEVDEILKWGKRLPSLRAVSSKVYDQTGGNDWYKVRAVLERYAIVPGVPV